MRPEPNTIDQLSQLLKDIREIKEKQTIDSSILQVYLTEGVTTFDFDSDVPSFNSILGTVRFTAETQDFPFTELDCDIYIDNTKVVLGEGMHYSSDGIGFRYIKRRVASDNKAIDFDIAITNFDSITHNYKLKFKVNATDVGTISNSLAVGVRNY